MRYAATGLTLRVRDKCDACRVDCISRVRHLVGCLALTDEYIQHHLDYIFDRALAVVRNVGYC